MIVCYLILLIYTNTDITGDSDSGSGSDGCEIVLDYESDPDAEVFEAGYIPHKYFLTTYTAYTAKRGLLLIISVLVH